MPSPQVAFRLRLTTSGSKSSGVALPSYDLDGAISKSELVLANWTSREKCHGQVSKRALQHLAQYGDCTMCLSLVCPLSCVLSTCVPCTLQSLVPCLHQTPNQVNSSGTNDHVMDIREWLDEEGRQTSAEVADLGKASAMSNRGKAIVTSSAPGSAPPCSTP